MRVDISAATLTATDFGVEQPGANKENLESHSVDICGGLEDLTSGLDQYRPQELVVGSTEDVDSIATTVADDDDDSDSDGERNALSQKRVTFSDNVDFQYEDTTAMTTDFENGGSQEGSLTEGHNAGEVFRQIHSTVQQHFTGMGILVDEVSIPTDIYAGMHLDLHTAADTLPYTPYPVPIPMPMPMPMSMLMSAPEPMLIEIAYGQHAEGCVCPSSPYDHTYVCLCPHTDTDMMAPCAYDFTYQYMSCPSPYSYSYTYPCTYAHTVPLCNGTQPYAAAYPTQSYYY
jgi:hypothetical protein